MATDANMGMARKVVKRIVADEEVLRVGDKAGGLGLGRLIGMIR